MNQLRKGSLSIEGTGGQNLEPHMATVRNTENRLRLEHGISQRGGHKGSGKWKNTVGFYSPESKVKCAAANRKLDSMQYKHECS